MGRIFMAVNFLEQLVAEWYEYRGYFIRRNVWVGKLAKGGYECELDIIDFIQRKAPSANRTDYGCIKLGRKRKKIHQEI